MEPIEGDDELQRVISDIIPNYKYFKPVSEQETRNELLDPFDNAYSDLLSKDLPNPASEPDDMPRLSSQELADIEVAMPCVQDLDPFDDEVNANDQLQAEASEDAVVESDDTIDRSSTIDNQTEDDIATVQKRPGRPLKRKRGRHAEKVSFADESSQVDPFSPGPTATPRPVSAPERKRGGPAKRTSSTDNSSQVDQTTASSPRPAPNAEPVSAPNASKRRTRSSTGDLPVPAASPKTAAVAAKRGRGRPKGSGKTATPAPARKGRAVKKPVARKVPREVSAEEEEDVADDADPEQEWEVEKILDDYIQDDGVHMFHVKWKGFSADENTWEPKLHLAKCTMQMKAYHAKKK
ncbi:hypothetical protein B0T11DRAFT_313665 [Plectosphaerella cucumerina]|uniref:Chromo domain-containing protein n=1 Tax=Plectosphaerella cucumerina TaxID=40658 RepID=A0A8K0X849_9PEZI|nr:hypothetical protein B0T11DRAFT_313665 [Plectosphaerella cucumerina]